jgi:hypothetical protein
MEAVGFNIGIIGGVAPLIMLALWALLQPVHDPEIRNKATKKAYDIFTWVGILMSVFVAFILLAVLSIGIDDPEWMLGLFILWSIIGYPFLALLLLVVLYGLYVSINARRDLEFVIIALHSSFVYIVSFVLMFRYATDALLVLIYLPIVVSYPIVCITLSRHGKRRLTSSIA